MPLPKKSDDNNIFRRECKQTVKKAKRSQIQKLNKKKKNEGVDLEAVSKDLEMVKKLDNDVLVAAVARVRSGEKAALGELGKREAELATLIVHSGIMKRFIEDFEVRAKRRRRKKEKRSKIEAKKAAEKAARKESGAKKAPKPAKSFSSKMKGLHVGNRIRGIIDGAESYGLFLKFIHKKEIISGLCHISEVADRYIADVKREFPPGTWVNAKVLKVDKKNERVSVTLKGLNTKESLKRARLDDGTGKVKGPTSEFVGSLGESTAKRRRKQSGQPNTSKAVFDILNTLRTTKGTRKNRLGQRERKRLNQTLYGGDSAEAATGKEAIEKDNSEIARKRQRNSALPKEEVSNEVVIRDTEANEGGEKLHPSWAAKRKSTKLVAFQGSRITFN